MHLKPSSLDRQDSNDLLPDWIQEGYVRDDVARDHQERYPGSTPCLQTLAPPTTGMTTQTEIRAMMKGAATHSLMLLGTVIWIGPLPRAIGKSGSLYYKLLLGQEETSSMKPADMESFMYQYLGSLHGQRIVGVSSFIDPIECEARTAVILYVFDDNMLLPWTVEGFVVVDEDEITKDRPRAIQAALHKVIGRMVRS